jgi:nucleoside-diphosphate-sugar epimerase
MTSVGGEGKIAVVLGARGGTGSQIVARLAELEAAQVSEIRAVVRDASKVDKMLFQKHLSNKDLFESRLEAVTIMEADVSSNDDKLKEALKGAHYVFNACSGKGSEAAVRAVDRDSIPATLEAIEEVAKETIERYVLVSSMFVHPDNRYNPLRVMINTFVTGVFSKKGIMDYKWEGEELLRTSKTQVPFTIVRPGQLTDRPLHFDEMIVGQTNSSLKEVGQSGGSSRADISAVCVVAAMCDKARNTTFEVGTKGKAEKGQDVKPVEEELFLGLESSFLAHGGKEEIKENPTAPEETGAEEAK